MPSARIFVPIARGYGMECYASETGRRGGLAVRGSGMRDERGVRTMRWSTSKSALRRARTCMRQGIVCRTRTCVWWRGVDGVDGIGRRRGAKKVR
jgi:hypothetical protein